MVYELLNEKVKMLKSRNFWIHNLEPLINTNSQWQHLHRIGVKPNHLRIHFLKWEKRIKKRRKGWTLGEEAIDGFVRIHVTVFEHGVDLCLRAAVHNLFQTLYHLPRPWRDIWNPVIAFLAAHLLRRKLSLSLSLSLSLVIRSEQNNVAKWRSEREKV